MEIIAYRLEVNGHGPFWCVDTFKALNKLCRKGTPDWKQHDGEETFLYYYTGHAESPYDDKAMQNFVDHYLMKEHRFAFPDKESLIDQFGLRDPFYRKQLSYALEHREDLVISEYIVSPKAITPNQLVYHPVSAELIQQFKNLDEFFQFN